MSLDPAFLVAIGDVFLNLSAGWFGAAVIFPATQPRSPRENFFYVFSNLLFGAIALAIGYRLRILEI